MSKKTQEELARAFVRVDRNRPDLLKRSAMNSFYREIGKQGAGEGEEGMSIKDFLELFAGQLEFPLPGEPVSDEMEIKQKLLKYLE